MKPNKRSTNVNRERIKLSDQHRGIKDMRRLPDAIIVVDARLEFTAVKEANGLGIPIIAIVDSNTNPNNISYPILQMMIQLEQYNYSSLV